MSKVDDLRLDATFPVFLATDTPRAITIEFAELPQAVNRRKSRLSDNGYINLNLRPDFNRCLPALYHDVHSQLAKLYFNIHLEPLVAREILQAIRCHCQPRRLCKHNSINRRRPLSTLPILYTCSLHGVHYLSSKGIGELTCRLMAGVTLIPILLVAVRVVSSLKIAPYEPPKTQGAKKTQ